MTAPRSSAPFKARARELGFLRAGVAKVEPLAREAVALRRWVAAGYHGEMAWMADTVEVRLAPDQARMLEGARSVLVLAAPYARPPDPARRGPTPGVVARYARGRDYHNVLGKRARKVARMLVAEGHRARVSVDALPVLERAWAQRAGVGFVGKNCCVIVPGLGSHVFLAAVVTDAVLAPDRPMAERCGACRACLDACPTDAFVGPRVLDARRCVSYLTIEHPGPIDPALRPGVGPWLFGCDACQDVCPFNRTAPEDPAVTAPFALSEALAESRLEEFLGHTEESFRQRFEGSPLRRAGAARLARNAALVAGNRGARRLLPVLREAEATHPDEGVRDAARWALERLS